MAENPNESTSNLNLDESNLAGVRLARNNRARVVVHAKNKESLKNLESGLDAKKAKK